MPAPAIDQGVSQVEEPSENPLPLLARLDDSDAAALRAIATRRRYPAGATLFFEGDTAHEVVIIAQGDVSVFVTGADGREVVIDVFSAGSLLGELSAIDGLSRSASATALVDVDVLTIPTAHFATFLHEYPKAQRALLEILAARLRGATRRHLEFGTVDALGRVCARIDELTRRFGESSGDTIIITSPINQSELGNWAGLSREAVVKALRSLRKLGWIDTNRSTITVRDLAAIRARARSTSV